MAFPHISSGTEKSGSCLGPSRRLTSNHAHVCKALLLSPGQPGYAPQNSQEDQPASAPRVPAVVSGAAGVLVALRLTEPCGAWEQTARVESSCGAQSLCHCQQPESGFHCRQQQFTLGGPGLASHISTIGPAWEESPAPFGRNGSPQEGLSLLLQASGSIQA